VSLRLREVRIQAFEADLAWHRGDDGKWSLEAGQPRSCSEKDNHAGYGRPDAMKYYCQDLPPSLQKVIVGTPCD
jgi:hypothetical protein